jgi:UDP-glucose 4-epimerase
MKGQHILVIGGAGYIGSACVAELVEQGYRVTVLDNLRTGQQDKIHSQAEFIHASILDTRALNDAFAACGPLYAVIHLAALKAAGESESMPAEYFETNVTGTINVLTAMEKHNVPAIVFSSTAAVYAESADGIYTEVSAVGAKNVYGATKLLAEKIITEFARTKKIERFAILRYFNVAGDAGLNYKERNAQNVFPIIAHALATQAPFSVFGDDYETRDGTCIRDYIHLTDLVAAHVQALSAPSSCILNLGTTQGTTVLELVCAFEQGSGEQLHVAKVARRAGDPAMVIADATHAGEVLGWKPARTLGDMVESTLRVYKK